MAVCVFSLLLMIVAQITIQLTAIAVVVPATPTAFQSLNLNPILYPDSACAVERRTFLAGANPARQLSLQPVVTRAVYGGDDMD